MAGSLQACARRLSQVLVFLLLLGFVAQSSVVQSHVHFLGGGSALAAAPGPSHANAASPGKGDSPADCPLCQEAAMAGAYVLPAVPILSPPPAPVIWTAVAEIAAYSLAAAPLGWQSRAPPQ